MAELSIGEVETLTGVKAQTLRYWEEAIPLIQPRKDDQGRRFYGMRTVDLIIRIRTLVRDERLTLEGARERLMAELVQPGKDRCREEISAIREELLKLYSIVQRNKE